jgi:hypothetical protein
MPVESSPPATAARAVRPVRQILVTVALLAAALALGLLLLDLRANRGSLEALAAAACRGDAEATSQLRRYLHVMLGLVPLSTIAFAGYIAVLARRSRREGVFPPSSAWMIATPRRTFTGAAARRCAAVMLALAGALAVLAALLTAIGVRMLALLDR